ncbi:MAG: class I SAM-dependent methyltransferase, partial [bacterium]
MAETGVGTDECLKQGCLPMLVHYYSPVPDIEDLKARRVSDRRSPMAGIDVRAGQQLELLAKLGRDFGHECRWPHDPTEDKYQFFTNNTGFSYGCAAATHGIIRKSKPRRVIEVGSGASSRVIAAALRMNALETGQPADYTIVDPYPGPELEALPGLTRIVRQRVELLDVDRFKELGTNDVLFVDSGHTVRIGGDVNFLILDVLPVLAPGVIAHFHDIALPYEYAEVY